VTILAGNVGALGQSSLKRMLAYSSVAQAGYMLAGVVVTSSLGVRATVFYLAVYLVMNLAAFAVIIARERETSLGDDLAAREGIGATRPVLAWPMTIAMLALAGIPATGGFIGKFFLIEATVDGGYAWLGVVIVIGSMISLAYYLRVIAAIWMRDAPAVAPTTTVRAGPRPALAGGSPEGDAEPGSVALGAESAVAEPDPVVYGGEPGSGKAHWEVALVAVLCAALIVAAGVVPQPLFDLVQRCGDAFTNLV
jgi:NADH-quinone oxidoreductase subunit N